MGVYIIGFTFSLLLLYYAESRNYIGNESKVAAFVAVMIPCFIAGLRATTIGTDVEVYVENMFRLAEDSDSLMDYLGSNYTLQGWQSITVSSVEIGFTLLVFLTERIFGSLSVLLFFIQALTVIPIYKGLRAIKPSNSVWLGMAVYYLMFFNQSLNAMRQWIALAFLFYAFQFILNGQNKKYFLCVGIAFLFHRSALLGLIPFIVYKFIGDETKTNRGKRAFILVLIGFVSLLCIGVFAALLKFFGLRYSNYIDGDLHLVPNQMLYRIPILLLLLTRWKYLKSKDPKALFYVVMVAYDLLASQLISIFVNSGRIALFFNEFYMLAYPALCASSNIKNNRRIFRFFVLCFLCIYWWYIYANLGIDETVPYVSIWG